MAGGKSAGGKSAGGKRAAYKLATYRTSEGPRAGLVIGGEVFDAAKLTGEATYATVSGILADWKAADGDLKKAAAGVAKSRLKRLPLSKTKLLPPLRPLTIFCAGANYADHAAAMAARENMPPPADPHEQGLKPWHFLKATRTIADPGATVKISGYAQSMDWEIELAAVIGRPESPSTTRTSTELNGLPAERSRPRRGPSGS